MGSGAVRASEVQDTAKKAIPLRVRARRQTAIVSRWLHIYLSMVSFAVVLFFAVTGLTLNHAEWFAGQVRETRYTGSMPAAWVGASGQVPDKLAMVDRVRAAHGIHGTVSDYRVDDGQVSMSFKAPGYAADAFVDRGDGTYEVVETRNGMVAVLNDLHKGRDAGAGWGWVIDGSAVLLTLVSLTGLLLLFFVYKRRVSGLVLGVAGAVVCWLAWLRFVP
jgi:hypothetical protein